MSGAKRWRVYNAVLVLVIVACLVVAATAYARRGRSPGTPVVAASPPVVPSSAGVSAVPPVRPTLAKPCTLLTGGDFTAVDVASPAFVPFYGPGRKGPLPGQIACIGGDATSYAVFWSTSASFVKALFRSDRAAKAASHWALKTIAVVGADEAYWIQRDDLTTVPLTPDQQAIAYARAGLYSFSVEIPRSTPDAGSKLQTLAALLIARLHTFGLSTRWLT